MNQERHGKCGNTDHDEVEQTTFFSELIDRPRRGYVYVVHEQDASRPAHLWHSLLSFRLFRGLRTLDHVDFADRQIEHEADDNHQKHRAHRHR